MNDAKVLFHLAELAGEDDPETAMELFKAGSEAQGTTDKRFKIGKPLEQASFNNAIRRLRAEKAQPKQPPVPLRGPNGTGLSPEEMAQQGRIEETGQFEEALPPPPGGVMTTVPPSGGMNQPGAGMAGSGSGPVIGAPNLPWPGQRPTYTGPGLFVPRSVKQAQEAWDTATRQLAVEEAKRKAEFEAKKQEFQYVSAEEEKRAMAAYQSRVAKAESLGFKPGTPQYILFTEYNKVPEGFGKEPPTPVPGRDVPFSPAVAAQKKDIAAQPRVPVPGVDLPLPPDVEAQRKRLANASRVAAVDDVQLEELARSIAGGDLTRIKDVMSVRAGSGMAAVKLFNMIRKLNPKFSTAELDRKVKMESDFTTGKDGQNIQSLGIFLEHAGAASEAIQSMRNVTNSRLLNRPVNWWKTNVSGDPQFQSFMVALDPVRKEFESFLLGGRALYAEDRKTAEKILDDNSSPNQIQAALKQMGHTAKARFTEANYRYKKLMKKDLEEPFSPESIEAARRIGVNLAGKGAVDDKAKGFREKYKY
jgi:hypothetical protein